jgi:hypothetical protein
MGNRICSSETTLSEYLSGSSACNDRAAVEQHLVACSKCRQLLVEAHEVTSSRRVYEGYKKCLVRIMKNRWLVGALTTLVLSFLFSTYFFQFLAASLLMGSKWIVDMKTTRMLIMIHDAWKRGDKTGLNKELSRFKHFTF